MKNMGNVDRIIRLIVAAVIAILYFNGNIAGTTGIILGAIGIVFLVTGITAVCPLYMLLKIKTVKNK